MKYRKFKLAKEKKKAGWVLQAVYSIGELEAVLKSSARFEEILFTSLYRKVPRHKLRWREAQRARRKLCGGSGERRDRLKEKAMKIIRETELKVLLEQLEDLRKGAEFNSSDESFSIGARTEYQGKEDAFGQAIQLIKLSVTEKKA